jgi:hypothetical protein
VLAKICLIAILGGAAASHSCDIAGQWVSRGRTPSRTQTWIATDIANKQGPSAPKDAKVGVTVSSAGGSSYTTDAEINTAHQAQGNPDYPGCTECPGPFATWKACLHPPRRVSSPHEMTAPMCSVATSSPVQQPMYPPPPPAPLPAHRYLLPRAKSLCSHTARLTT